MAWSADRESPISPWPMTPPNALPPRDYILSLVLGLLLGAALAAAAIGAAIGL